MGPFGDAIHGLIDLLDMLGALVRKAWSPKRVSLNKEFRSRDNAWLGATTLLILGLLVIFLLSCGQEAGRNNLYQALEPKEGEDAIDLDNKQDPCNPIGMPGYELASPLARKIADGEPWDFSDELASLALIDSFQTSRHRAFYSALLLRTLRRADGYYAEPLGIALHAELLERPCSMLSCCWENGCDGRAGLLLWTNAIAMEFMIANEEDPWAAFVKYGEQVEARAKAECDLQSGSRANEFLYEIGVNLKHALQRDSIDASR